MRVLISAYACEPNKGSEPEVGFRTMLAIAERHETWVITRENNLSPLEEALEDHPARSRIHLVGLEVNGLAKRLKKLAGPLTLYWYYDRWQRAAARLASDLDEKHDFDLVHHVTFANYWSRVGVSAVDKPLVWGPVGGGVKPPVRLIPVMGFRGALGDVPRILLRPAVAFLSGAGRTASRASVVIAQNRETAEIFKRRRSAIVLPNALLAAESIPKTIGAGSGSAHQRSQHHLVMAGRLIAWKGGVLALHALHQLIHESVTLSIYGEGPQERRLSRMIRESGLEDRVRFHGAVPRDELMRAIANASALLHPALHEEAGFVVAEALALGTPVVALARGGPPILAEYWPGTPSAIVESSTPNQTAAVLASGIRGVTEKRGVLDSTPAEVFGQRLADIYNEATAERSR